MRRNRDHGPHALPGFHKGDQPVQPDFVFVNCGHADRATGGGLETGDPQAGLNILGGAGRKDGRLRQFAVAETDQQTETIVRALRTGDQCRRLEHAFSSVDRSDHRDLRTRLVHFEPALADEETARPPDRSETRASGLRLTRTVSPVRATVYLEPAQPGRASRTAA